MNLQLFLQLLLNGLVIGLTYVLVATGFTVVYGTARVLNFAHGHYYMLGAFIYGGLALLGLHWALSLILTALALGLFGLITWHLIFKPLYFDVFLTVAASIGMGLIMVQGIIVTAGERDIIVPSVFQGSFDVGDVTISIEKLEIVGIRFRSDVRASFVFENQNRQSVRGYYYRSRCSFPSRNKSGADVCHSYGIGLHHGWDSWSGHRSIPHSAG